MMERVGVGGVGGVGYVREGRREGRGLDVVFVFQGRRGGLIGC